MNKMLSDFDAFLESIEKNNELIKRRNQQIGDTIDELSRKVLSLKTDYKNGTLSEKEATDFWKEYIALGTQICRDSKDIFIQFQPGSPAFQNSFAGEISSYQMIDIWENEFNVVADFLQDSLIVSMPTLPVNPPIYYVTNGEKSHAPIYYMHYFDNAIRAEMDKIDEEVAKTLATWNTKTINIFHVYKKSISHIPDSDNHDYKAAIDSTCICFPTGDSGKTTSIFICNLFSDSISAGTYFIITQGSEVVNKERGVAMISEFLKEENAKKRKQKTKEFVEDRIQNFQKTDSKIFEKTIPSSSKIYNDDSYLEEENTEKQKREYEKFVERILQANPRSGSKIC